jgi:peptidyl-prolyl cis-trans isomerase SurA
MEALEKEAQKQGISYEDFKQNLKNEIIRSQVIQREVGSHITVSQEEQKQFYEEHRAEMEQPEQVRLSEILVAPQAKEGEEASQEAITAAEQKAKQALAEIKGGKSFNEVAQKYSNGPTAAQGGDLGYFKRGTLAKELETLTFGMKTGEVSDVVRTKQGFVILKVDEHMQAGVPPLKNVEGQIGEQIYLRKLQPALREYLTKLREDAFIDVKPGYVDSGASPNQTKPVITTASTAQDTGKEKTKKKKKLGIF